MSDTLVPEPAPPALSASIDRYAQVRVAGRVTRYLRRGSGHPVLMLSGAEIESALWPALTDALAVRSRVIVPEAPVADASFVSWIRGFLDGVGCAPVTLIAGGDYCMPALELALLDGDRLARLVMVPRGWGEETGVAGELVTRARTTALPVLVVRRVCPLSEAVALVERFVAGE